MVQSQTMKTNQSWTGIFAISLIALGLTSCVADKEGGTTGLTIELSKDRSMLFIGKVEGFDPTMIDDMPKQDFGCAYQIREFPRGDEMGLALAEGLWCGLRK